MAPCDPYFRGLPNRFSSSYHREQMYVAPVYMVECRNSPQFGRQNLHVTPRYFKDSIPLSLLVIYTNYKW